MGTSQNSDTEDSEIEKNRDGMKEIPSKKEISMKTGIVTWVSYNNYGTSLQAYALQKKVQQLGYENLILDDRDIILAFDKKNKMDLKSKNAEPIQRNLSLPERVIRAIRHPARIGRIAVSRFDHGKYEQPFTESQRLVDDFKKEKLKILHNVSVERLSELNDKFDIFIAGSDQIWRVFEDLFNPYYYLNFVTKRKVSYAPCLGTVQIPEKNKIMIKQLLSDYSAVSVREKTSAEQLSKLTGKEVEWVADPTILHTKSFWEELSSDVPKLKKGYLLCYFLENKEWYFKYAQNMARQMHLKIVLLPNNWEHLSSEYITKRGVGPKEFVSFIQHAEYVLTDSYHGAIFSLIFEKQFRYLLRFSDNDPYSQNIRIRSLFDYLELNERIVTENGDESVEHQIDYGRINKKIDQFREKSVKYLEESLS